MKISKILSVSLAAALLIAVAGCADSGSGLPEYSKASVKTQAHSGSVIADKALGAWVGSAIGLGSGYEYVTTLNNPGVYDIDGTVVSGTVAYVALGDKYWEPNGQVCSGSIGVNALRLKPLNDPRVFQNCVISDDDMHVDVLNQFIFRDYGADVGAEDIAKAWDHYDVHDVGGGESVTNTIRNNGYVAPYTGQSTYGNTGYWVTESWIENDTLGLTFPYMYETCEAYADLFTSVQGDALSRYLGRVCALMQCLAYESEDATVVMEKAFSRMNHNNEIYEMYEFVKSCHEIGLDWRETCVKVVERRVNCKLVGTHDVAGFSINANAGMIFLSLFYGTKNGKTDFEEAIRICSLCGLDGDCTAATVGGIVGAMYGYESLPEKYTSFVGADTPYYNYSGKNSDEVGVNWGPFAYCGANFPNKLTFRQIADLTVENIKAQIVARGGSIEGDVWNIPVQDLTPIDQVSLSNNGFEMGTTYGWEVEDPKDSLMLDVVSSNAHLGQYGGKLETFSATEGRAFRRVDLVEGHRYRAEIWVNGLNDREFRFYVLGGGKEIYRSFVNPLTTGGRHAKLELWFTAPASECEIGLSFAESGEEWLTLFFDDLSLEDVTLRTDGVCVQTYEAENCYRSATSTIVKDGGASGKKALTLKTGEGFRTNFTGTGGYQQFRIYYSNCDTIMELALVKVSIDDKQVAVLPLPAQGTIGWNDGNFADLMLAAGEGAHIVKIELLSYYDISVDKIEIHAGDRTF